ncbi:MAG: hypothetical protein IT378_06095 [Sandaracinaceae bacterium]|nr:hypothetical protein [Sandaracinaceae bacterium]
MRSLSMVTLLSLTGSLTASLTGCMGSFGADPEPRRFDQPDEGEHGVVPACPVDPDCAIGGDCSLYVCPDYWICEELGGGRKRCVNPGPRYPDGGQWTCEDRGSTTVCTGSTFPDGGGGSEWTCESQGDLVVCTDNTPSYPDAGAGGPYNCWFSGEFRVCETIPGDGGGWSCYDTATGRECRNDNPEYPDEREWECWDAAGQTTCRIPGSDFPDGGGGSGWNCVQQAEFVVCTDDSPDFPDEGGGSTWDCRFGDEFRICNPTGGDDGGDECVAGTQRWCDDAIFCSWGKQTCLPDGTWGACIEPTVTRDGLQDRPATECGCRFFYYNDACCEDQEDRNADGHPDCIIPTGHTPPACPSDGGLCSYCDSPNDCGGPNNLCVFRNDGYAFCARDCSADPGSCGAGYSCAAITTRTGTVHQCVPNAGTCG